MRHYTPLGRSLATHLTAGATVRRGTTESDPGDTESHDTGVGGFVDLGLAYFVTPHLTLNGVYGVAVQRISGDSQQFVAGGQLQTIDSHGWAAQTTGVRAAVTIFF